MINRNNRNNIAEAKEAVRKRYQTKVDASNRVVIPAKKKLDYYDNDEAQRVAVYARVSTDSVQQTSSYELQKNYYEDFVTRHPNWTLVDIYADEGISGTSLDHRDAFNKMIADCRAGKIDMIITKNVSRFARNIVICIGLIRELAALRPAVGVYFEMESIFSLKDDSQMALAFQATMAQEESHVKSRSQNASHAMRTANGILLTPELYGYYLNESKELTINPEEAPTVKLIFYMYLYGYSTPKIAETLTALGRPTYNGNAVWSPGTIIGILRNERHCGNVLTSKTYTPDFLTHKSVKNRGELIQYNYKKHHEPIISPDDFVAVQRLLANAKYGHKSILPTLTVVKEGRLKGFVTVNPRWAGFKADNYRLASASVYSGSTNDPQAEQKVIPETGDFDMRGFEMVRSEFFDSQPRISVSLYDLKMKYSSPCVKKFGTNTQVELLIHPSEKKLAVRVAAKNNRNAIVWSKVEESVNYPKDISGAAYIGTLFEICGWNSEWKYRLNGVFYQDNEPIIIFDMSEPEIFIPSYSVAGEPSETGLDEPDGDTTPLVTSGKRIKAIPESWAFNFGPGYYEREAKEKARRLKESAERGFIGISESIEYLDETEERVNPTPSNELRSFIRSELSGAEKKEEHSDE